MAGTLFWQRLCKDSNQADFEVEGNPIHGGMSWRIGKCTFFIHIECIEKQFGRQPDLQVIQNSQNLCPTGSKKRWRWVLYFCLREKRITEKVSSIKGR